MRKLLLTASIITLGAFMTIQAASAEELRPSQVRSLESAIGKIDKMQAIIEEQNPTGNMDLIKARIRDLTNVKKQLSRLDKSLNRLPDHADVTKGMNKIQTLEDKLDKVIASVESNQGNLNSSNASSQADLEDRVAAAKANGDIQLMSDLSQQFMKAWGRAPKNIDDPMRGGIFKVWSEEEITEIIYIMKHRDELLKQAKSLLDEYTQVSKTRAGVSALGSVVSDLKYYAEKFEEKIPLYIETLPIAFDKATHEFRAEYQKEQDGFAQANKERDKSRLLSLGNPHAWYQSLRNQMKGHIMVYEATGGGQLKTMKKAHADVLAFADTVSNEITSWQKKQKGEEAAEYQRQLDEQEKERKERAVKAAADKKAWEERRKKREEDAEARRLRLLKIRKVDK